MFAVTAIIVVPLAATVIMAWVFVALAVLWSPFAALITWRLTTRTELSTSRMFLTGGAYSTFMLIPWILLVIMLIKQRLPKHVITLSNALLFLAWLIGPIVFWGQYAAGIGLLTGGGDPGEFVEPNLRILGYVVWSAMLSTWICTGFMSLKKWGDYESVVVDDLLSFRYITPFALAWVSTLVTMIYLVLTE